MGLTIEIRRFIGNQLRFKREDRLLSMEDCAALAGISDSTIFRIEHGHNVSRKSFYAYLDAMGLRETNLLRLYQTHRQMTRDMPERT